MRKRITWRLSLAYQWSILPCGGCHQYPKNKTVLITGDGAWYARGCAHIESWIFHTSVLCQPVHAVFWEAGWPLGGYRYRESGWFAENVNFRLNLLMEERLPAYYRRWVICLWCLLEDDIAEENTFQRRVLVGNTGYFAILTAINMGYQKIVLAECLSTWNNAGMSRRMLMVQTGWAGCMVQWMDFNSSIHCGSGKSLSGYSLFILGKATKDGFLTGTISRLINKLTRAYDGGCRFPVP